MSEPTYEELIGPEVPVVDEDVDKGTKLQSQDLFTRLQGTFSAPAYITLAEVRDATGFDGTRTADAIAISLYRSRGKALWGFEFKISRNDWLKELKQPEKAESIMQFCNYWGLVVPDKDIVKAGELPETWGLYVAQKNRLKCVVPCPKLDPAPMNMRMFTALAYAINQRATRADDAALNKARNDGYQEGSRRTNAAYYEDQYNKLLEKVHAYEKASGLSIQYGWQKPEKIGAIVKMIMDNHAPLKQILDTAKYNLSKTEDLRKELEKQIAVLENVMAGTPQKDDDE